MIEARMSIRGIGRCLSFYIGAVPGPPAEPQFLSGPERSDFQIAENGICHNKGCV